jgi:hypothetical protein
MKVKVLETITLAKRILHPGEIVEIPDALFPKLGGRVEPVPDTGKDLPHYCPPADCWCSEKLPGNGYPAGCAKIACKHCQVINDT